MDPGQTYLLTMTASLVFVGFMIYQVFRSQQNKIECWQLISSRGVDGHQYADIDKVGKVVALFLVVGVVIRYVSSNETPSAGMLTLLAGALIYLGGIASFASFTRARFGAPGNSTEEAKP